MGLNPITLGFSLFLSSFPKLPNRFPRRSGLPLRSKRLLYSFSPVRQHDGTLPLFFAHLEQQPLPSSSRVHVSGVPLNPNGNSKGNVG